jgi:hypothetical protein
LKKGTQLLEVYAVEIQMYTEQRNNKKLKQLYHKVGWVRVFVCVSQGVLSGSVGHYRISATCMLVFITCA